MFVFRVGPTIVIENIDPFPLVLNFIPTYTIEGFMQQDDLDDLNTIEMVVTNIYERSSKPFIMFVFDGEGNHDTQAIAFFLEFYLEYM
jgi:hypothetical protein